MHKKILIFAAMAFAVASFTSCEKEEGKSPLQKVDALTVSPQKLNLKVGETYQLQYTIEPAHAKIEAWSSDNGSIAAVDKGKVYAGAITGTTVITARAGGKEATCIVTVSEEEEVKYPICYEVKVNIGIHTVETAPSSRNPAPKKESFVQISGTLVGEAIVGRVEKIVSDPGYWMYLKDKGYTPVFIANSDYDVRDDNLEVIFQKRCPLQVNIERTEWDYKNFGKDGEKYVKTYDHRASGINDKQSILMGIHPYYPILDPIMYRVYAVALNVQTYTEHFAKPIPGNGRILKWDDYTMQLEPYSNEVSVNVMGKYTSQENQEHIEPVSIMASGLNDYFLNPSGGTREYIEIGSEIVNADWGERRTKIMVKLNFRSIPDIKALSTINPPPPPLEDWDYE